MANEAAIFIGWTRPFPGRERDAMELLPQVLGFLGKAQAAKRIESFEPVMLLPHGGDLNGFILVRGDQAQVDKLAQADDWQDLMAHGMYVLQGFGNVPGVIGEGIQKRMQKLGKFIR